MRYAEKLTFQRRHRLAVSAWKDTAAKVRDDDYSAGETLMYGLALLLSRQYYKAISHFGNLAERRHCGLTIACHRGTLGLAYWFSEDRASAVKHWRRGLSCNASGYDGLEIPLLLLFACARDSSLVSYQEVVDLVNRRRPRVSPFGDLYSISRLVVGEISYEECIRSFEGLYEGKYAQDRYSEALMAAKYYSILMNQIRGSDENSYYSGIYECATFTQWNHHWYEGFICECEMLSAESEWSKKYRLWLRRFHRAHPVPKKTGPHPSSSIPVSQKRRKP